MNRKLRAKLESLVEADTNSANNAGDSSVHRRDLLSKGLSFSLYSIWTFGRPPSSTTSNHQCFLSEITGGSLLLEFCNRSIVSHRKPCSSDLWPLGSLLVSRSQTLSQGKGGGGRGGRESGKVREARPIRLHLYVCGGISD